MLRGQTSRLSKLHRQLAEYAGSGGIAVVKLIQDQYTQELNGRDVHGSIRDFVHHQFLCRCRVLPFVNVEDTYAKVPSVREAQGTCYNGKKKLDIPRGKGRLPGGEREKW